MRFALMTRAPAGDELRRPAGVGEAAEANGFDAFFRSDHYASFPGAAGQPDDRRLDRPRRPGPRDDRADRPRRARLAGHVPPPRRPRQGRHDRRRDERRAGRGRRRRRLERRRAPPARAARSRRSRSGRTCWRTSSRSSTACGASPTAGRSRASPGSGSRTPCSARGRSTCRAGRRPRRAASGRGSSSAAAGRHARIGSPRAMRTSSTSARPHRTGRSRSGRSSTRRAGRSGAIRRRSPARRWRASWSAATDDEVVERETDAARRLRRATPRPARRGSRSGDCRWVFGTPDEARAQVATVRGGRHASGSCSRTSSPGTST